MSRSTQYINGLNPRRINIKITILNLLSRIIPFGALTGSLPAKFILCGHVVQDEPHIAGKYYQYPSLSEFDSFLLKMQRLGYRFVNLSEYLNENDEKKILLTFDDGYKTITDVVHPFLLRRGIPYVIFILTEPLSNNIFSIFPQEKSTAAERIFLSPSEVKTLKSEGVHIGFHTRGHKRMEGNALSDRESLMQLSIPPENQDLFSTPLCFAYPYYAPMNYSQVDSYLKEKFQFEYFFDGGGFTRPDGNHHFRVFIDLEKDLTSKDRVIFVVKRQLLFSMLKRRFKS